MPYIQTDRRPALDTILDGLIAFLRKPAFTKGEVRWLVTNLVIDSLRPGSGLPYIVPNARLVLFGRELAARLIEIKCVRGDLNYCVTRIVLGSLKPEGGWGYHSLSDAIAVCNGSADTIIDECGVESKTTDPCVSVFRDVADEIKRRLLGPYEDKCIFKNGDMACFANEPFAYLPPIDMEFSQDEMAGGCGCTPLSGCSGCCTSERPIRLLPEGHVVDPARIIPPEHTVKDCRHRPVDKSEVPITEALTNKQLAIVEEDRGDLSDEAVKALTESPMRGTNGRRVQYRDPSQSPPVPLPHTVTTEEVDRAARTQG